MIFVAPNLDQLSTSIDVYYQPTLSDAAEPLLPPLPAAGQRDWKRPVSEHTGET